MTPGDLTHPHHRCELLATLRELGEWSAVGFYEALDLPWPRPYGRAFLRLYENMDIVVPDRGLLIPCEPLPRSRTMESHGAWSATALVMNFNHHCGFHVAQEIVDEKKLRCPEHAELIDALAADLRRRLVHFGGYTHSNPDMRRVVGEGFAAMERELDEQIAAVEADGQSAKLAEASLLAALRDYATGVRTFHRRTVEAVRDAAAGRPELSRIADALEHAFFHPSRSFLEGMLAVNFAWMLDGCDSIGRLDQVLGGLYERDIASGALDVELARRLLDELFCAFERFNGWNLQIGGFAPDGRDGTNALTLEFIDACRRNRFRRPNVALRITSQTPDAVVVRALEALRDGSGRPALYNDDLYVRTLRGMDLGLNDEDAREVGFGGCTETMIAGLSNVGSLEGEINLAKALELALHDGFDPVANRQVGPHTGRFAGFADYDAFEGAVRRQIQFLTDAFAARSNDNLRNRFTQGDPKLHRTMFTRDCVKRRTSFEAGGARYNWSVVSYQGIANTIDSLAAIRSCVFERKTIPAAELMAALAADFEGYEPTRQKLLAAPKFGNDMAQVDDPGRRIVEFAWRELYSHQTPRGGRYLASCILFTTYAGAGKTVGATPDGRRALTPLVDSAGPAAGRDRHGPTAMLSSVTRLPLTLAIGTPVINIRFQKQLMSEPSGLRNVVGLIRAYFAQGGVQIQVSVLDKAAMLAAQRQPEKHGDLIVRIGGYSEYFTRLSRGLQDSVIERTEHGAP
jgi:formate C-acetyltransferase